MNDAKQVLSQHFHPFNRATPSHNAWLSARSAVTVTCCASNVAYGAASFDRSRSISPTRRPTISRNGPRLGVRHTNLGGHNQVIRTRTEPDSASGKHLRRSPQLTPIPAMKEAVHLRHEPHDLEASLLQHAPRSRILRVHEGPDLRQP